MLDYVIPYLVRTFSFDPNSPLLFTQFYFWGFFAVVFAVFSLIHSKLLLRNAFLFATSLFFYYKTSGSYVCILIFCVIANFFIGKWIEASQAKWKKKFLMIVVVFIDLLVLCYYKYSYFFLDALYDFTGIELHVYNFFAAASNKMFNTHSLVDTIILPVGISFFTFQAMSYCIDIYRGKIKAVKNILDFGFYLTFFPQLVAGPIVRADKFVPQLYKKYFLPRRAFGMAVFWILNGLFKNTTLRPAIALAYITGIMPIVRDKIQSKLNEFREYTMLRPLQFAEHIGFTIEEVKELCDKYNVDYKDSKYEKATGRRSKVDSAKVEVDDTKEEEFDMFNKSIFKSKDEAKFELWKAQQGYTDKDDNEISLMDIIENDESINTIEEKCKIEI